MDTSAVRFKIRDLWYVMKTIFWFHVLKYTFVCLIGSLLLIRDVRRNEGFGSLTRGLDPENRACDGVLTIIESMMMLEGLVLWLVFMYTPVFSMLRYVFSSWLPVVRQPQDEYQTLVAVNSAVRVIQEQGWLNGWSDGRRVSATQYSQDQLRTRNEVCHMVRNGRVWPIVDYDGMVAERSGLYSYAPVPAVDFHSSLTSAVRGDNRGDYARTLGRVMVGVDDAAEEVRTVTHSVGRRLGLGG